MPTLMFQPRFHEAVTSGKKRQTIRPPRKRPIRPGDRLSLRAWSGAPYRSRQRVLREAICVAVERIEIDESFADDVEARNDGFGDASEMLQWFRLEHGLPFVGDRITWGIKS